MEAIMKSYSVTVTQWITFNIEAEDETQAETTVMDCEVWMPDHTGDTYDCEITTEEND